MTADFHSSSLQEVHLRVANTGAQDVVLVLEPWGEEHALPKGDVIEVVANGPAPGSLDVDVSGEAVTVSAWPGSTAYLFRDGREFGQVGKERPRVPMDAYPKSLQELSSVRKSHHE